MGGRTWGIDASPRGGYAPACKLREAPARASVAHSWRRKWYYVHVTRNNNPSIHQHLNTGVEQGEQGQRLLPQLLGRESSAVLPRKFVDVTDCR